MGRGGRRRRRAGEEKVSHRGWKGEGMKGEVSPRFRILNNLPVSDSVGKQKSRLTHCFLRVSVMKAVTLRITFIKYFAHTVR